jgi:hypothetical protein
MTRIAVSALLTLFIAPLTTLAQDRSDSVDFLDRSQKTNPKVTRRGSIATETPAKLTILTGVNRTRLEINVADLVDVKYDGEPPEAAQARAAEGRKDYDRALTLYKDAKKNAPAGNRLLQTHLQFKTAKMQALAAETGSGGARLDAINELRAFRSANPDSRQIVECLELLSRLLTLEGQSSQEVVDAFRLLKTKYAENKEIVAKCDLFETQLLLQEGQLLLRDKDKADEARKKYQEAQQKLQAMLPGADKSSALEMRVSLAECKAALGQPAEALKDLDLLFKEAGDDAQLRAAAHLGRGDCYRLNNQFREAMWDYLWVDVVYNQDREQNAKALYYLWDVLERMNEQTKAGETKQRLQNDPRFKDTRFQKMAAGK